MKKGISIISVFIIFVAIFSPCRFASASNLSLSFSTYLGGGNTDDSYGIDLDSSGNIYVTGSTKSLDFPVQSAYQGAFYGGIYPDAFVTKISSSGSSLSYSTYLGGNGTDTGKGIDVDEAGYAYVGGNTSSTNFPTLSPYQVTGQTFVSKFTPEGSAIEYSTYIYGGQYFEGIAVDSSGSAYITGYTSFTNYPTANPYMGTYYGVYDGFVTKLIPEGSALSFSTYLGGSSWDNCRDIAVTSSGSAYVTGETSSSNFPTLNAYDGSNSGIEAFVTRFSPNGMALYYSTFVGGTFGNYSYGITLDSSGVAYITGYTYSSNFPTQNPYIGTLQGVTDAFVSKLSPVGSSLLYSTYLGGGSSEYGFDIAVDSNGFAYVTGYTDTADFPTKIPYQGTFSISGSDVFVTKLSTYDSDISYSTYLGGTVIDLGQGIVVGTDGSAYIIGVTTSTNFPTRNPYQGTFAGGTYDVFVTKLRLPSSTAGIFRPSNAFFYLRNLNSSGSANFSFSFGSTTDTPLTGDWEGDGDASIGVYRPSNRNFYLRNLNSSGTADFSFTFGGTGDTPIVGDWDGDGDTTIGVYRFSNRTFYLRNANSSGAADTSFVFGGTGDTPIYGDWDGDGDTTIGVYRSSNRTFYVRNSNSAGSADATVVFGGSGDTPITGDWDGDADTTIGTRRSSNSTFYLRNSNSAGPADLSFVYGSSTDKSLSGDWDGN